MRRIALILLTAASLVLVHHTLPMLDMPGADAMATESMPGEHDSMPAHDAMLGMLVTCAAVIVTAVGLPRIRRLLTAIGALAAIAVGPLAPRLPVMALVPAHPPPIPVRLAHCTWRH